MDFHGKHSFINIANYNNNIKNNPQGGDEKNGGKDN